MKKGTIILTPFPFTDLEGKKLRPALVISSSKVKGNDVIVAFISSVINTKSLIMTDFFIHKSSRGFKQTGLKKNSVLKLAKIATIDRKIILGELGYLTDEDLKMVNRKLKIVFDLEG